MNRASERVEVTPELLDDYLRHCGILEAEDYSFLRLPVTEVRALVERIRELEADLAEVYAEV
jgi:hypothetical protein